MFLFCMQDHSCADLNKWKISSLSFDSHHISTACLLNAGPHRICRVRQHMGDKVIEKWDWGVTPCWRGNIVQWHRVKSSGFKVYQTFSSKSLTSMMAFQLWAGNVWNVKTENSIVAQYGWWMSNTALMQGRVRSEGKPTPATTAWVKQFWCDSLATTTFSCAVVWCTCNWELWPYICLCW